MSKSILVPDAKSELSKLKEQVVQELGLSPMFQTSQSRGDMPSHQAGRIGGEMVRRMIEKSRADMAKQG